MLQWNISESLMLGRIGKEMIWINRRQGNRQKFECNMSLVSTWVFKIYCKFCHSLRGKKISVLQNLNGVVDVCFCYPNFFTKVCGQAGPADCKVARIQHNNSAYGSIFILRSKPCPIRSTREYGTTPYSVVHYGPQSPRVSGTYLFQGRDDVSFGLHGELFRWSRK